MIEVKESRREKCIYLILREIHAKHKQLVSDTKRNVNKKVISKEECDEHELLFQKEDVINKK